MGKGLRKKTPAMIFAFIMSFMMLFGSITPAFAAGEAVTGGLNVTCDESGSISIEWEAVEGVYGYKVYRACEQDKVASKVIGNTKETYYTDTTVEVGKTYQYRVRKCYYENGKVVDSTEIPISIKAESSGPVTGGLSVKCDESGPIKIEWEAVAGVYGYKVYRACAQDNVAYKAIGNTTETSYTDTTAEVGKTYQYRVRQCYYEDGKVVESTEIPISIYSDDTITFDFASMTAPAWLIVSSAHHNLIQLEWPRVDDVDYYELWRCDAVNEYSAWDEASKVVIEVDQTSDSLIIFDDITVEADKHYLYRVVSVYGTEKRATPEATHGYSITIEPIPPRPFPLTSILQSPKTIILDWPKVDEAVSYIIYRSVGDNAHYTRLVALTGSNNITYTDNNTDYDTTYYYMIRAINSGGVPSLDSNEVNETTDPEPVGLKAPVLSAAVEGQNIRLTWTKEDDKATGYKVYRATSPSQIPVLYKTVAGVNNLTLLDEDVIPGQPYYYVVRAYNATMESVDSNKVEATVPLQASFGLTATLKNDKDAELIWDAVKGASEYLIYYKIDGGSYTYWKTVNGSITTDTYLDLEGGKTYTFQVTAKVGSNEIYSNEASVVAPIKKLGAPVLTGKLESGNNARLDWTAVDGAKQYEVYVSTDGTTFSYLNTVNAPTITLLHQNLTPGVIYYYYVVAKADAITSERSNIVNVTIPLKAIMDLKATAMSANSIKLNWSAVTGAAYYDIYRSKSASSGFVYIGTTNAPTIERLDTGLEAKTTYYYYVIARSSSGVEAAQSNIASATTLSNMCLTVTPYTYCCNTKHGMYLRWTAVPGAKSYTIYRSTYDGGYTKIATTSCLYYDNTCLSANTRYWYKVVANTGEECVGYNTTLGYKCSWYYYWYW